jgi:hypothetical protein
MLSVRNCGDYRIGNSLRALLFFILDWQIQKAVWALQDALLARREHGRQEESNSQRGAQHARNTAHTIKMAVTTACIYSPSYILPMHGAAHLAYVLQAREQKKLLSQLAGLGGVSGLTLSAQLAWIRAHPKVPI